MKAFGRCVRVQSVICLSWVFFNGGLSMSSVSSMQSKGMSVGCAHAFRSRSALVSRRKWGQENEVCSHNKMSCALRMICLVFSKWDILCSHIRIFVSSCEPTSIRFGIWRGPFDIVLQAWLAYRYIIGRYLAQELCFPKWSHLVIQSVPKGQDLGKY